MAAPEPGATMTTDRIDLVYENDARRVSLGLIEQVTHTRGADAHKHLHEFRPTDREEGHAGLAGDGLREKRLSGAWGPDEEHTLRNSGAERCKFLRVFQKLDDLFQLFFGFVDPCHVEECHAWARAAEHSCAALAEIEGLIVGALGLP